MELLAFLLKYGVLCSLHFFLGMRSPYNEKPFVKLVTRSAPLFLLITTVASETSSTRSPLSGISGPTYAAFFGLVFSMLGNAYAMYPQFQLLGLLSYVINLSLFTTLFGGGLHLFVDTDAPSLVAGVAVALATLVVFFSVVSALRGFVHLVATAVYFAFLSVMLWSALVKFQRDETGSNTLGAVSAGLYYLSHLLMAVEKWRASGLPLLSYLSPAVNYAAQLALVMSLFTAKTQ